ncbi:MAG TPA: LuxR C-terminal-related transcriptional regulator [Euzebyales bacterium]|nr:LuxR C-terminal-related transcriptional regulator [Euzebyales bacterium]
MRFVVRSRVIFGVPGAPPTPFVGRRDEVADLRRHLERSRVVTLTGPPGVGKTRLALRTAEGLSRGFTDGIWFVDLVALGDPGLLTQEVAGALGLSDASTHWAVDGLAQYLRDRDMLLLLDNCEHLVDACAVLVDSLSRTCPSLRVLATSRQSLGIRAETVVRVPPLGLPDEGSVSSDAVDLLLRRAAAVDAGFSADEAGLRRAAVLCRRLDGIPLAIELAAGRLRTLTIDQILARLGNRFDMLAGRDATAPAHQRTLRAALDWSRDLASAEEWALWRRASAFATGFDLPAAEEVCSDGDLRTDRVLEALDGLVDKSVVIATRAGSSMRYRMLDTVREYGMEALRDSGEDDLVHERLVAYYAGLVGQAWQHWTSADQPEWFDRLAAEHGNLRAALDRSLERDVETGCAMAADMWLYWEARGHITEGRRRLGALLAALPTSSAVRPKALWVAGYLAVTQTDIDGGVPLLRSAVDAAVERSDDEAHAYATQYLGLAHLFAGDLATAGEMLERAFRMHVALGSKTAAFALTDLAVATMLTGELPRAVDLYEQALVMTADDGDPWTRSHAFWGLGVATFLEGALERAEQAEKDALDLIGGIDERSGIALCLEALAWIAADRGAYERAARLQGASFSVWESIPGRLPPPMHVHAQRCERRTVDGIGAVRRQRCYEQGRRLDRAAAVAMGLERPEPHVATAAASATAAVLSRREDEVAALVAEGLTDREIASRLVISQRTAESHVQHILSKLGFRSRTQIATWVTQRHTAERYR